jgi:hypothetical protein
VELKRSVIRHDRVVRQVGGDKIRIDSRVGGVRAGRDDSEQTPANPDEPAGRDVPREEVLARVTAAPPGRVGSDELVPAKDRVRCKEAQRALRVAHMRKKDY